MAGTSARYFDTAHQVPSTTVKGIFSITSPTFTTFPRLPTELRLKIWRHCFPKPRAIPIFQRNYDEDGPDQKIIRFECFTPHPTVLAVNRESRNEALRFYIIIHGPHNFCVAFDSERDTIYGMTPPAHYTFGDLSPNLFEKQGFKYLAVGRGQTIPIRNEVRIKSLAVNDVDLETSGRARQYLELDELIIVRPSSLGFRRSDIGGSAQVPPPFLPHREQEVEEGRLAFLKRMEKWVKRESEEGGMNQAKKIKMPIIKVVQWGTLRTQDDLFCVPLTPLCLRKDNF